MAFDLTAFSGEIAALTAAGLWAFATLLFGRLGQSLTPLKLNLSKGLVAIAFILITLTVQQQPALSLPKQSILLLLLSGGIGIGLGDTAYFATVNALGPRRALLTETLAPPLSAMMAFIGLGEALSLKAWVGILLTVLGIAWVISERVPSTSSPAAIRTHHIPRLGIVWGILAASGQALGAVLSRAALADTSVDPLVSTLLRLLAGSVCLVGLMAFKARMQSSRLEKMESVVLQKAPQKGQNGLKSKIRLGLGVAIAAFLGTYLAIWLQQIALKYAATGVAQSLLATSPLFAIPMALILGERVSLRASVGVCLSLLGVCLFFIS